MLSPLRQNSYMSYNSPDIDSPDHNQSINFPYNSRAKSYGYKNYYSKGNPADINN